MFKVRACSDCRFYVVDKKGRAGCSVVMMVCSFVRTEKDMCGLDGKWFEPNEEIVKMRLT